MNNSMVIDDACKNANDSFNMGMNSNDDVQLSVPSYYYEYYFNVTSSSTVYGKPEKVSQDVRGPGYVSVSTTKSISSSFSVGLAVSASLAIQKIVSTLGVEYIASLDITDEQTSGAIYSVPQNKVGYITFTPKYTEKKGNLIEKKFSYNGVLLDTNVILSSVRTPIKLQNNLADGIYSFVVY